MMVPATHHPPVVEHRVKWVDSQDFVVLNCTTGKRLLLRSIRAKATGIGPRTWDPVGAQWAGDGGTAYYYRPANYLYNSTRDPVLVDWKCR